MLIERSRVAEELHYLETYVLVPVELIVALHQQALLTQEMDLIESKLWHVQNWWPDIFGRILRLYERAF